MVSERKILDEVTNFYVTSTDFNGIPVTQLVKKCKLDLGTLEKHLASLIQQDKISMVFGDAHPNPHIKAFDEDAPDVQIEKLLNTDLLAQACIYPSRSHLKNIVEPAAYQGKPFTLRLALGEPQLSYESFDLRILEFYRNDPRYFYETDDTQGMISVHDKYYESDHMMESDQVLLESFGFSFDSILSRAVAVFLSYLSDLSPEHQQIWNARIVKGDYTLHPAYFMSTMGEWPERKEAARVRFPHPANLERIQRFRSVTG